GRLSLCRGMPVMIKFNEATECCVTNGAEAIVVGWTAKSLRDNKQTLDTVFVRLVNPPNPIQLHGLPENVVPVSKLENDVTCTMPNNKNISIKRQQVPIVPNFGMTDYCSQGRTRPMNVVDLQNCRTHQSMYTCLSRSASIDGTVILQGFDPKKIQAGLTGHLRQEFRELEILDDITQLAYMKKLPDYVNGSTRNKIINSYQIWKGTGHVPKNVPLKLKWSKSNPLPLLDATTDTHWQILKASSRSSKDKQQPLHTTDFTKAKGSSELHVVSTLPGLGVKRKKAQQVKDHNMKKQKSLIWQQENFSCAYDSAFTIMYHMFRTENQHWQTYIANLNAYTKLLTSAWPGSSGTELETIRDQVRQMFHKKNPTMFPNGQTGTSIADLCMELFTCNGLNIFHEDFCQSCNRISYSKEMTNLLFLITSHSKSTIQQELTNIFDRQIGSCQTCGQKKRRLVKFRDHLPPLIAIELINQAPEISKEITLSDNRNTSVYKIKGIIYSGDFHFTARIMDNRSNVWYYDGVTTKREPLYEGTLADVQN
ncbi:hypothetical protein DENSPDRAFT_752413, partial [Dentipellis sp. KUC8613]